MKGYSVAKQHHCSWDGTNRLTPFGGNTWGEEG